MNDGYIHAWAFVGRAFLPNFKIDKRESSKALCLEICLCSSAQQSERIETEAALFSIN